MKKQLAAVLVVAAVASQSLWAGEREERYKNGQDLTGTWRIRVSIPAGSSACPAGPNPCTFLALATATSDGTIMQTAALPGTSTGHGVWKRTGLRTFIIRTTYFRLNATGFPDGTAETTSEVEVAKSGLDASGTYENKVFDLAGNQIGSFTAGVSATRIEQ